MPRRELLLALTDIQIGNRKEVGVECVVAGGWHCFNAPADEPISLVLEELHLGDVITMIFYSGDIEIAVLELSLKKHFPRNLVGRIDSWF